MITNYDYPSPVISWVSPLSFLGTSGVIFKFYSIFFMKFLQANRTAPDGTPQTRWDAANAASHLGLFCLPMSHKRDARLKGKHYYLIPAYDFHETSYATRQLYPRTKIEIKVGSHWPRFHGIRTFRMFLVHFRKPHS